jgi:beta-galactosidase
MRHARLDTQAEFAAQSFVERLKPLPGTIPIAHWLGDDTLLANAPAATSRPVGLGQVIYIGAYLPDLGVEAVCRFLMTSLDIHPIADAPAEVEILARTSGKTRYVVLLNHSRSAQQVANLHGHELLTAADITGEITIEPFDVAIVEVVSGE